MRWIFVKFSRFHISPVWIAGVVMAALIGAFSCLYVISFFPGNNDEDVILKLEQGSNLEDVSSALVSEGIFSSEFLFDFIVKVHGLSRSLLSGEYFIPASSSVQDVVDMISKGLVLQHRVTIIEGWTSFKVVEYLESTGLFSGSLTELPPEGYLAPDTYHVARGRDIEDFVSSLIAKQKDFLDNAWLNRDPNLPFDTELEALSLASIIEKETPLDEEKARIAGVFVNRMRKGMRLQSDPTVVYGLTDGKRQLGRSLLYKDLLLDHSHNTYQIRGLPPTPIANPGQKSIEAALNPMDTDELYFVADGSGGHIFAKSLDEHNANVRKWRKIRELIKGK